MAYAGSVPAGPRQRPPRSPAATPAARVVRWDRLGRVAMLLVLCFLLYLYISPARSLVATIAESGRRNTDVAALTRANLELRAERDALATPSARERDARGLGLVRPGEKEFVIAGLPAN